jgi:hypothetical protein
MRRFIDKMTIKPPDLADRIDALFMGDVVQAALLTESLVKDTLDLVDQHMPQIDTTRARGRIGWRQQSWQPPLVE